MIKILIVLLISAITIYTVKQSLEEKLILAAAKFYILLALSGIVLGTFNDMPVRLIISFVGILAVLLLVSVVLIKFDQIAQAIRTRYF